MNSSSLLSSVISPQFYSQMGRVLNGVFCGRNIPGIPGELQKHIAIWKIHLCVNDRTKRSNQNMLMVFWSADRSCGQSQG